MKRFLLLLLFLFVSVGVDAQNPVGLIVGATPVVGGSGGQCLTIGSGTLNSAACGSGASVSSPNTWTGYQTFTGVAGTTIPVTITANAVTFNVASGTVFTVTNTADITSQTISNVPANKATSFEVDFKGNGTPFAQTPWPCSFPSGVTPTLTSTLNKVDRISYYSNDGTTFYCTVISQNY